MLTLLPPGLSLCLSVGLLYSSARLKGQKVVVLNSRLINAAGRLKAVMFDKTGTLTEDKVDLASIMLFDSTNLVSFKEEPAKCHQAKMLLDCMAVCQTLVFHAGQLIGDPVEEELYSRASKVGHTQDGFVPIKVFEFSPNLKRMSVVVESKTSQEKFIFCKGAPEVVLDLCVNNDLDKKSVQFTIDRKAASGLRSLVLAGKKLGPEDSAISRDALENCLQLLGVALFDNPLKEKTAPTIQDLKGAGYAVSMVTGDSVATAIAIAKKCGIFGRDNHVAEYKVDKFSGALYKDNPDKECSGVMDGTNFELFCKFHSLSAHAPLDCNHPDLQKIVEGVRVFARMSPEQKAIVVDLMKSHWRTYDCTVAFCGDGANDTLALQSADVGICLSKTDGALVSPFVSHNSEIDCVIDVAKEGKASLTTNFEYFRYFCTYSMIQTIGMMVLMNYRTEYSNTVYIIFDVLLALNLCNCLGLLKPADRFVRQMPRRGLLYWQYLTGIGFHCLYSLIAIFISVSIVSRDPNYRDSESFVTDDHVIDVAPTFENTVGSFL